MSNPHFPNIIGQPEVLDKLSFHIEGYKKTRVFPNLLLTGARGYGKTELAKAIGYNLMREDDTSHKQMIVITGAEFKGNKSLESFIANVIDLHVDGNQETTLIFDEIHEANDNVKQWLLHVINPERGSTTTQRYRDREYTFDFKKFSFIAATTNPEKLSLPLWDRFEKAELRPYNATELINILKKYAKDVNFLDNIENEIVDTTRNNPRIVVRFVKYLESYLAQTGTQDFGVEDWKKLSKTLNIRPLGLLTNELETLKFLANRKSGVTLTEIGARLALDRNTVQRNVETFLLNKNLIYIDGKRFITPTGLEVLRKINQ